MSERLKNYRCYSYRLSGSKNPSKDYSFNELKDKFDIRGSSVCKCKKSFDGYEEGKFYLVSDGSWCGCGYVIGDYGMKSWTDWSEK